LALIQSLQQNIKKGGIRLLFLCCVLFNLS